MGTHSEGVSARRGRSVFFVWLLVCFLSIGFLGASSALADDPEDDPTPAPIADPPPSPDDDEGQPEPTPSVIATDTESAPSEDVEASPVADTSVLGETLSESGTDMTGLSILGVSLILLGAASYGLAYRAAKLR